MQFNYQSTLEKYKFIRLASSKDNNEILEFLKSIPMESGEISLRYERAPDFFSLLKEQGESSAVFVFLEKDGSIGGLSALSIRACWLEGRPSKVAYLSDLRVSPTLNKRARVEWRKCYAEILKNFREIEELEGVDSFYSSILDDNEDAIRSFTRDKSDIVYKPMRKYDSINILGRIPLLSTSSKQFKSRLAINSDKKRILKFLADTNKEKVFGQFFTSTLDNTENEWSRRFKTWNNIKIEDFILVEKDGDIVSLCLPWSNGESRRLMVDKANFGLRLLGKAVSILRQKPIGVGHELKVLYLTHLEFSSTLTPSESAECLSEIIDRVYNDKSDSESHIISYLNFEGNELDTSVKGGRFVVQKTPATIYQVMHRDELPNIINIDKRESIGFELGLA